MILKILYKSGYIDEFGEKDINCSRLTIKGHASELNEHIAKDRKGFYKLDDYNLVNIDEIISVRVV